MSTCEPPLAKWFSLCVSSQPTSAGDSSSAAWCTARRPIPACTGIDLRRLVSCSDTLLRRGRTADDALAGAGRNLHPLLAVGVLLGLARARMTVRGAIVLAGLGDAVTLLRGLVV